MLFSEFLQCHRHLHSSPLALGPSQVSDGRWAQAALTVAMCSSPCLSWGWNPYVTCNLWYCSLHVRTNNKLSYMSVTTVLWDGAMRDLTLVCVLCEPEIRCVEQTRAEGGLYLCMRQCFSSWSLIWFAMWDRSRGLSDCKPSQWKHLCACLLHQNTFAPLSQRIFHTLYLVCLLQKYLLLFTLFHLPQLLLVTVDINLFGLLYWWKGDGYFQCNVGFLS